MNPSDWRKAAALVTQQKKEAAMAEMDQLSSMPLSQMAIDDSGPPIVHCGMHMPIAASTPIGTDVHMHSSQQEDSYQQITQASLRVHYFIIIEFRSSSFRYQDTITL